MITDNLCVINSGMFPSGVPMTRPYFIEKAMEVLSLAAQSFAGHSFWVGAAMTTMIVAMKIC